MKNPLLVPELREMLVSNRTDELRDFVEVTPPEVAAEFVSALSPAEQRELLMMLEPETRSLLFGHLDEEAKLPLIDLMKEETVEIVAKMSDEVRINFLESASDEEQSKLRETFEQAQSEEAKPLLEQLQEVVAAEPEPVLTPEEIASEIVEHIETFKIVNGRVEKVPRLEKGCWVNLVNPTKDNLPLIAQHFKVPVDFLTAALDLDETARIELEDNATLFIVKVPYFDDSNTDILYFTIPIGIIFVEGYILTVCPKSRSVLDDFVNGKVRNVGSGHRFILQLILRATLLYLQYLKQLNNAASIIQKKLEQESRNRQLIKLFHIEKSLVYFTTSLKSNLLMLERLNRLRGFERTEQNEDLLEDIFTECKQAIEMANIYSDILSGMMDAFASVISNNLNIVMRVLTLITIIITIPVLVASFYGMNVPLPFQSHPYAFAGILGVSVMLSGLSLLYFVKKRWLDL